MQYSVGNIPFTEEEQFFFDFEQTHNYEIYNEQFNFKKIFEKYSKFVNSQIKRNKEQIVRKNKKFKEAKKIMKKTHKLQ